MYVEVGPSASSRPAGRGPAVSTDQPTGTTDQPTWTHQPTDEPDRPRTKQGVPYTIPSNSSFYIKRLL